MKKEKTFIPFWLKLFLFYSVIMLCMFAIAQTIVFPQITGHSKSEIQDQLDAQAAHVIDSLEFQLESMRSIYIRLKSDNLLQNALLTEDESEQPQAQKYIIKSINTLSSIWNPSIYITLYDCNSDYFYSSRYLTNTYMGDRTWMNEIDAYHGMFNFRIVIDVNDNDIRCLTIGDTIHKSLLYEKLGYFSVNIIISALESQIFPPDYTDDTLQIMVDENGNYVMGDQIPEQKELPKFSDDVLILNGQKYIISHASSETYGFTHYILIPEQDAYHNLNMLLNLNIATILVVMLITILLSFILARQITIPINQLTSMVAGYNGDAETQHEIRDLHLNNEFSILNDRLVQMSDKITSLIQDVYQQKIIQQQLELRTLYKSINPHFIYNILDTIQWELRLNQTEGAINTLYAFSHYLRNTLVLNQEQKTLKEAKAAIQDYCNLQNIVSDQVIYESRIPESLDSYVIPSMVVLPLVENCYIHAFPNTFEGERKIIVSAHIMEQKLVICVEDTGCGIAPEDLRVIDRILESPLTFELKDGSTRFFAVKNLQSRIHLSCGTQYGLKVSSSGTGTISTLYLPLQKKENESEV